MSRPGSNVLRNASDDNVIELETKLDSLREKAGVTKRSTIEEASPPRLRACLCFALGLIAY